MFFNYHVETSGDHAGFLFFAAAEVRRLLRLTVAHYVMESLRKLTFALLLRDPYAAVEAPSSV